MPKMRVHEVAKQLNVNSKVLIDKLNSMGIEAKNHMSTLEGEQAQRIIDLYSGKRTDKPQAQPPVQKPAAKQEERKTIEQKVFAQSENIASAAKKHEPQKPQQNRQQNTQQNAPQHKPQQSNNHQQQNQNQNQHQNQSQGGQRQQGNQNRRPDQGAQGNRGSFEKRPYQGQQGQQSQGQRPPRPEGQRPDGYRSEGQRPEGQRPHYDRKPDERRPYNNDARPDGQRQQYNNSERRTDRPPFEKRNNDGRPPFEKRNNDGRPPFEKRNNDGRPPFEKRNNDGRPPFEKRNNDGRPPFEKRQGDFKGRPQGGTGFGQGGARSNAPFSKDEGDDKRRGDGRRQDGRPPQRSGTGAGKPATTTTAAPPQKPRRLETKPKPAHDGKDSKQGGKPVFGKDGKKRSLLHASLEKPVLKAKKKKQKPAPVVVEQPVEQVVVEDGITLIKIPRSIKVKDFAEKIDKPASEIIKRLMKRGILANLNQEVDYNAVKKIGEEFDIIVEKEEEIDILGDAFSEDEEVATQMEERPPVVVVMGHVDHGKTSLLDSIRKTNVTAGEAGGITQHIGAYTVSIDGKPITFLDTPGHEAFTAMRMRGAQVTDIAILVVAADDGVMPQTIEAIDHAKAAGVDIIIAINKMDKPSANPDRVKQELTEHGLLAEDWGGETICVPVSAMSGDGIDHLLEMIILVAEMKELKADPHKKARGTVIEASLDRLRGPVATVLVQQGTLKVGDPVVVGTTYGKIRAMTDDKGRKVHKASPSIPVEILGLSEAPHAGDMFYVAQNEKQARVLAESVVAQGRQSMLSETPQKVSLDDLFNQIQAGKVKDLNIVVKADVQGSVEAVKNSLERLTNDEVRIRVIHGGVGAVTESDVMLASASNAIIIGFNVRPEPSAKSVADIEGVDVRMYRIIYNAIEDITAAMKGMLDPVFREKVLGHGEIRQIFKASGVGNIAGVHITDGKIVRNEPVRILRDNKVVFEGTLEALKRFKDDAKEVLSGYECGMTFTRFNDIKEKDIVECYTMEEIPR